jgi:hypothetical protein
VRGNKKRNLLTWGPKDKEKSITRCKSHSEKLSKSVIKVHPGMLGWQGIKDQ